MKKNQPKMFDEIKDKFNPSAFEQKIYRYWLKNKYFSAKIDKSKVPFSMVIPPPNVTGYLHIGHALNNTLQDVIVRYKRMKGFNTTWGPGKGLPLMSSIVKQ